MGDGAPKIGRAAHDDAELEAAEARAEELKERFAFATDDRERQEALRLASEATMRVNTMRAACECPPSIARRAADEASRALKDARHMLEKAEEKQEPVAASPPKPDAAERRVRSPGVYERQSTASNATRSPTRPASALVSTTPPRRAPTPTEPSTSPSATSSQTTRGDRPSSSTAREAPSESNASQKSKSPTARSPDVEHAAAVRVQRVQRGRAARERVKALSDARRVAAKEKERETAVRAGATPTRARSARGAAPEARRETKPESAKKRIASARSPAFREAASSRLFVSPNEEARSRQRSEARSPSLRDENEDVFAPETETARRKGATKTPTSARRAAAAAARRLKLRLEAEMAAARESALADARRESRNRRVMYPGEEKFYERLDHARAESAKKKSRPTSAVSSGPGESRASTPARARVSSAASPAGRTRDRDPTSAERTPSPAPRSAGGSSRASRSLRVSFEAARATGASAARRAARRRDAENADPIGSDPATRRAEEAERALRAAEAQRAAAEAAVAAARVEAERARREALLGPIPDDSESEYGALSPLQSFASPTRASRASRSSRASGSAATRSSSVRSARSSLTRSFMERSGLGSSLSSSIADDLDGAPTAPATPGVFPDDGENRGPPRGAARPAAPRSAPAKIPFSVFGAPLVPSAGNTLATRKTPATDKESRSLRPSARAAEPASRETTPKTSSTTEKAKAYAERVRASAARRSARKAAADAEAARRRADADTERLVRESREGASEARSGAERARALQRDATLYSRDMYRRAATAAFVRYYDWRRNAGLSEKNASSSRAFENARLEKELVHATRSMPAFRGLHPRFLPRLFAGASLETHRARDVVAREGERGACALVLVGGECATFKRRDSARGMESLDPDPDPWNPEARPRRSPYKVAREDDTGVPGPRAAGPARVPVPVRPGWETEAELLGAPPGSGPFVRRTRTGDLFGLGAVRGAREGEARCATLVALSETAVLRVDKRTFDEVMDATRRGEAAKTAAFLRTSPELFPEAEVSDGDLKALALALERVEAPPGARVVTAGDVARGVFFVREGRAEVFAKARVLVDAAGGGEIVDQALSRDGSERGGSERLRRGTGSGGGAAGSPLVERVRDVALGDLVAPAVFGEECLFAPRARRALAGARADLDLPKPGRHAFTVTAARGVGVAVLRLAPGELERLPASVARRILQLARSTAEASREAREALDAPPAAPAGRARDVVASPAFKRSPPPPARVGVVFGSSAKPPPSLVTSPTREPRLAAKTGRVSEGRRSPVGMGGGGGRTRASRSRSPARDASDASSPEDSPYSRFMRLEPESVLSPTDEGFERTAREVTEAALREAKSAERKLRAFRERRRDKNRREIGAAPRDAASFGGADARAPSRAGAGAGARRANSAPAVRMTKKAAAIAAKNARVGIPDRARLDDEENDAEARAPRDVVEKNESRLRRLGVGPGRAAAAFAFDADRARGALEASSRSRERAAEARASLRDSSLGRRPRREDFDDFEDAWEDAGRV
jgi:CRP-like cAMP-binding protein